MGNFTSANLKCKLRGNLVFLCVHSGLADLVVRLTGHTEVAVSKLKAFFTLSSKISMHMNVHKA